MLRSPTAQSVLSTATTSTIAPSPERGSGVVPTRDILVIEDDPGVADVLRLALQSEGHSVDVAADGEQGLTYLQHRHYRLLLLDLLLPGLDGMGVLRALHAGPVRRPPVVIILSALQGRADVARALEAGADDYLTKPFNIDDLALHVNLWLARRAAAQSHLQTPRCRPTPRCRRSRTRPASRRTGRST
jgi:two-component system, OmpR family, response regulator